MPLDFSRRIDLATARTETVWYGPRINRTTTQVEYPRCHHSHCRRSSAVDSWHQLLQSARALSRSARCPRCASVSFAKSRRHHYHHHHQLSLPKQQLQLQQQKKKMQAFESRCLARLFNHACLLTPKIMTAFSFSHDM